MLARATAGSGSADVSDEALKEWMRLPKEMLTNYCEKEKKQKPVYVPVGQSCVI